MTMISIIISDAIRSAYPRQFQFSDLDFEKLPRRNFDIQVLTF